MSLLVHICCGPCSGAVLERLLEEGRAPVGFFYNPNIQPLAEYLRRREGAAQTAEKLGVPIIFADALPEDEQRVLTGQGPEVCARMKDFAPRTRKTAHSAEEVYPYGTRPVLIPQEAEWTPGVFRRRPEGARHRTCRVKKGPFDAVVGQKIYLGAAPGLPTRPSLPPAADPLPWLRLIAGKEHERCTPCIDLRLRATALFARRRGFVAFTSSLLYSRRQPHETIAELGRNAAAKHGLAFHYADWRPLWQRGIDLSKQWGVYRQPYCGCMFSEYDRYAGDLDKTVRASAEKAG